MLLISLLVSHSILGTYALCHFLRTLDASTLLKILFVNKRRLSRDSLSFALFQYRFPSWKLPFDIVDSHSSRTSGTPFDFAKLRRRFRFHAHLTCSVVVVFLFFSDARAITNSFYEYAISGVLPSRSLSRQRLMPLVYLEREKTFFKTPRLGDARVKRRNTRRKGVQGGGRGEGGEKETRGRVYASPQTPASKRNPRS